ncbi:P-loop containing nucleoside triphosphate hydrolase protein [Hyaloraphidium curvatum]|nr:P-loop containing nucleoside triphosphate hydrolase protein [Hyaloraphidium curvatum]
MPPLPSDSEGGPNQVVHRYPDFFRARIDEFRNGLPAGPRDSEPELLSTADIKVFCRVRPMIPSVDFSTSPLGLATVHHDRVHLHEPSLKVTGIEPLMKTHEFAFDAAFGDGDSNEAVYRAAGKELVSWALEGGSGAVLAYGQTGSGKTFTMTSIIDQVGRDLFASPLVAAEQPARRVKLTVIEILGSNAQLRSGTTVSILEDAFGQVQIHNAAVHEPLDSLEFKSLMEQAFSKRNSATTKMNEAGSSRSHAVCKIALQDLTRPGSEDGILYLLDLAGSERHVDREGHGAERLKETKAINSSLMTLKDCIRSRATLSASAVQAGGPKKPHVHVPFRNSKITLLLKDVFDTEARRPSKCVVIACCSPVDVAHSLNTLRYAGPLKVGLNSNGARSTAPAYNPRDPATWTYDHLKHWIETTSAGKIAAESICPEGNESGMQILRLPENVIVGRILAANPGFGEKRAKEFYVKLWKLLVDARSARRSTKPAKTATSSRATLVNDA